MPSAASVALGSRTKPLTRYWRLWRALLRQCDPISEKEAPNKSEKQRIFESIKAEYQERYNLIVEVRANIYPDVIESEVLWSEEIRKIIDEMVALDRKLKFTIEYHLTVQNPDTNKSEKEFAKEMLKKDKGTLYATYNKDDEFAQKFEELFKEAEEILKKKLKK